MLGIEAPPIINGTSTFLNSDLFDADDSDDEEVVVRSVKHKQSKSVKAHRLILSDDDDDESDAGAPTLTNGDESHETDTNKVTQSPAKPATDSEGSDSEEEPAVKPGQSREERQNSSSDEDDSDDDSEDEEEDEEDGEIAFQLDAPVPDPQAEDSGARPSRRRKINKDELQQIHSETQRIVRQSTVRIPYYRPKPLSLNELFDKKPSGHTSLKPIGGKIPRIKDSEIVSISSNSKLDDSKTSTKDTVDELPDVLSSQPNQQSSDTSANISESNADGSVKDVEGQTQDNEPDATESEVVKSDADIGAENQMETDESKSDERTSVTPSKDSDKVDGESVPLATQDAAGTLSPPGNLERPLPEQSHQSPEGDRAEPQAKFKTPSPTAVASSQATPQSSQAKRMKLLAESLSKLKGLKPKLSGSPHNTIDLDEGTEPSPEEKGMTKLMMRFAKHTKHVTPKQKKEVQVNIVTKEKGADGKEDLKHHSFSVDVAGKKEELSPELNVPGAKLVRLKENLEVGMRARREQERQKREEAFQLDNEEGFGAEEDEEAELTDGSETDKEEEEGGVMDLGIGAEDDDADYVPGNEFVDDEADSDDDGSCDDEEVGDDDDEEDEEEEDEEDGAFAKSSSKKPTTPKAEKKSGAESDDEISPSRRKGGKKRAMVVDDEGEEDDDDDEGKDGHKAITLRLDSVETDDTDTEINDILQDSTRSVRFLRTPGADMDQKTMEMFDSGTNSTGTSDFQVPFSRTDKKVSWHSDKDTESTGFVLPAPVRQDSSSNSMDISFELTTQIPAHQPQGGMGSRSGRTSVDSTTRDDFTPFSKHHSILSNLSTKSSSRLELNPLTLPVEDSQDLFRDDSPRLPAITDSQQVGESQSFHFSFEETQTQFLDENGLLNLRPSSSKEKSKTKTLFDSTQDQGAESQSSMDELLGLCSGQFTGTQAGKDELKSNEPGPFSQVSQRANTQANMDELLDLCSGTFTGMNGKSQITSTAKAAVKDDDDDDDDDAGSFHIMSDPDGPASDEDDDHRIGGFSDDDNDDDVGVKRRRRIKVHRDDDDDSDDDDDNGKDEVAEEKEESDLDSEFEFGKFGRVKEKKKTGRKMNLAHFVENEAELSGSEAESDEDYDAEDEPDDEDLEGIVHEAVEDEDALRNQVNKVHMKTMDDDDARRLRIYKEMLLPDGDLHSDNKRARKFRWRHLDSQMDMFRPDSEGEEEAEDALQEQETQWRIQRYQREQWLKENEGKEKPSEVTPEAIIPIEEDSQFAKLLRTASFKKPRSETPSQEVEEREKEKEKDKKVATPKPLKIMTKRGSFLNRNKNDLAKMASMLKPATNPQGPRNNRSFVFQSADSMLNEDSRSSSEPPKVKRSASISGPSNTPTSGPNAKRPRLDRSQSQFTAKSVFSHF